MGVFRALLWVSLPIFALASAGCVAPEVRPATGASAAPSMSVGRLVPVPSPSEWRRGDRRRSEVTSANDLGQYYIIPSGTDVRAH